MTRLPGLILPVSTTSVRVPPHPAFGWMVLRLLTLLLCGGVLLKPALGPWAAAQPDPPATPAITLPSLGRGASSTTPSEPVDSWAQLQQTARDRVAVGASLLNTIYNTPLYNLLLLCTLLPVGCLALEATLAAGLLVAHHQRMRRVDTERVRIRVPRPLHGSAGTPPTGADLYRALHTALATQTAGTAPPYLALTVTGAPDRPAQLGAVVGGGTATTRTTWLGALRRALQAQHPEVVVDRAADPLHAAIQTGAEPQWLAWRELVLRLGPEHPLRLPEAAETDFLAALATAVKTAAQVTAAEVQIVLRPRPVGRDGLARWRRAARRLVAMCRNRSAPQAARTIEEKLHEVLLYDVSFRLVAVGRTAAHARAALTEMTSALGQYTQQVARRQQWSTPPGGCGLYRIAPHLVRVPLAPPMRTLAEVQAALHGTQPPATLPVTQPPARPARLPMWSPHTPRGVRLSALLLVLAAPVALWVLAPSGLLGLLWQVTWSTLLLLGAFWLNSAARGRLPVTACQRVLQRVPRPHPLPPLLLWLPAWRPPAILTPQECGALWHLPPPQLGDFVEWLDCRRLPAPPAALVTPANAHECLILGATTRDDGTCAPVGVPLADLTRVLHMIAGMGAGKSRLLINLIVQCFDRGVFVFDGKGDDQQGLTWAVRRLIPLADEDRLILIDLLDAEWPIGINPLAGVNLDEPGATDKVLGQIQAVFARLDPETWHRAPGMAQFLDQATLLVLAAERQPTLAHVAQALLDDTYRERLLACCTNREVVGYWRDIYPATTAQQKGSRDALLRRFGQLLVPELTRFLTTQAQPLDLLQAINDRAIILAPIPHTQLGGLAAAVGMLLFQACVRTAFAREGSVQTRPLYPIVMDEFHILAENGATQDVEIALSQLRAQNMPLILAHQTFSQVGALKDLLKVNSYARVIPQTRMPDAHELATFFPNSTISAADIIGQQPTEHQYVSLGGDPFSIEPLQWPTPLAQTVPRATHLRPWQQVLPPDTHAHPIDGLLLQLVYGSDHGPTDQRAVVDALERLPDATWTYLKTRWDAIRHTQRAYIGQHPACIPDALTRQRWRARLGYQSPRILVDVAYGRIRRAIDPTQRTADARTVRRSPTPAPPLTELERVEGLGTPDLLDPDTSATDATAHTGFHPAGR